MTARRRYDRYETSKRRRHRGLLRLAAVMVGVVVVGAAAFVGLRAFGVWDGKGDDPASPSASVSPSASPAPSASSAAVNVFLTSGEQLVPVRRDVPLAGDRVDEAVRALLRGPTAEEFDAYGISTAIPNDASLKSAAVDGSKAILVFNKSFLSTETLHGLPQAVTSQFTTRYAQVTFTATAVSGISEVEISVPGTRTVNLTRASFSRASSGSTPFPTPTVTITAAVTPTPSTSSSASASPSPSSTPSASPRPSVSSSPSASPSSTSTPSATPTPSVSPTTTTGIDPKNATQVQQALLRLKYLAKNEVTGVFDAPTSQAALAFQSWEGLQRDGIVGPQTAKRLAIASAPAPSHKGSGRWVEVHRKEGTVLLVDSGRLVRGIHCSSGRTNDDPPYGTPTGSYKVYAKQLKSWSVPYKVWLPYACYFNGGIAFHGYDSVPAYPASHGCVRLPQWEAPVLYSFVSVGTPVYVY